MTYCVKTREKKRKAVKNKKIKEGKGGDNRN